MVDDTKNCDDVGAHLEKICPELEGKVLVIHTKNNGDLSHYVTDFLVRDTAGTIWLIETKGREELDLPQKMARLKQWCADATAEENGTTYDFIYVEEDSFKKHDPKTLNDLITTFTEYK